ncbi:Death-on-curing family protein OS=Leifsonia shinshuensis OX=150026 GN=HNR13_003404 PE=4 SV=1 [Leifsonia shinshuensis]
MDQGQVAMSSREARGTANAENDVEPFASETGVEFYSSPDGAVKLPVRFDGETVWVTQAQMAELFAVDVRTINEHLGNAFSSGELEREATIRDFRIVRREGSRDVARSIQHYDLDGIISVGYRVHSPRGVHFRRWATGILRRRILDQNAAELHRLRQVTELLATSHDEQLASIGRIMQRYAGDLDRLADYDRGEVKVSEEALATARIDIADVERIVEELRERYPDDERLGIAKDDSIHGVIGQIDQTFTGQDLYPSAQEKAANLLYLVVKDHPFGDGNKRTGAALFAYFLDRNGIALEKAVPRNMLTALTLIAAASDPGKKNETVALIRSLISVD